VELKWPGPTPREKWADCPFTSGKYDPVNTLVAVVVENSSKARPQSGLAEADIVYEVLAEGGITRFLALFHCSSCKVIGPVRSTRPYFAVIAREWGAPLAHCGGDPKDIVPIRELGLVDVDELRDGRGFWRDLSRQMPHNLYVSANNVRSRAREVSAGSSVSPVAGPPWGFGDWAAVPAKRLDVRYGPKYLVSYAYAERGYTRHINGEPHRDRETGKPIVVSNVLVQFTNSRVAYPDGGLEIELVGGGKAALLTGGRFEEGTWEKRSPSEPTVFRTKDGEPARCAPGRTWIQVVPAEAVVSATQAN
jgi:hypothetical protein